MKIGILDIETTHLSPKVGSIVEVGIVELNTKTLEIKPRFDAKVQGTNFYAFPDQHKDAWVFQNTDLKFTEVCASPYIVEFKDTLQSIFNELAMTAFNQLFDMGFMISEGFDFPNLIPCIMRSATPILKLSRKGYGGYKYPSFQEAWNYYFPEIKYIEAHRALDDAMHEAEILREMIKRGHYILKFPVKVEQK